MRRKKKSFPVKPALLLGAAGLLLLGSTVGSTRAALTYYSENYSAQVDMSSIGVSLLENGETVSSRDYTSDGAWEGGTEGTLLTDLLGEGEKITPGKTYDEKLSVANSGNIDTFVRVILTKSWQDGDGAKDTTLSPDLIELGLTEGSGWVQADVESSPERVVLYYTEALAPGETTEDLCDSIRISHEVANQVTKVTEGNTIRYVYDYSGYSFTLDAEVDAVQTHNAQDAIKSAWGVDVNISADGQSLSLQ